jgi:hypothetical protein
MPSLRISSRYLRGNGCVRKERATTGAQESARAPHAVVRTVKATVRTRPDGDCLPRIGCSQARLTQSCRNADDEVRLMRPERFVLSRLHTRTNSLVTPAPTPSRGLQPGTKGIIVAVRTAGGDTRMARDNDTEDDELEGVGTMDAEDGDVDAGDDFDSEDVGRMGGAAGGRGAAGGSRKRARGSQQSAGGTRKSSGGGRKSSAGARKSSGGSRKSSAGSRKSAGGSRKSSGGSRKSAGGSSKSSSGSRKSSSGGRKSSGGAKSASGGSRKASGGSRKGSTRKTAGGSGSRRSGGGSGGRNR